MSNLPLQSAVLHNDDNDEQINPSSNNKLSSINTRITSPYIIKRQQYTETKIANNQACDEIHELHTTYSGIKKTNNNDNSYKKSTNSHELMQGNYYDQTRFDRNYSSSSSNHQSEPVQIDINVEDYKKKCTPISASENSSNKDRNNSPPFGDTSESIQENIAQSAGKLLEHNKYQKTSSMKTNIKSHERATISYFPNNNDNEQRSTSPSSSDCSTDDSSTSNKNKKDHEKTNIPYEKLLNDDDEDELIEQPKKPLTESSTLLNKTSSQTYGTQTTTTTTNERSKCLPTNGYNSHGSSITTKSSSDNSGSIRTNSGSDNDEESDEEHYNNSTINPQSMLIYSHSNDSGMKSLNKSNDIRYSHLNDQNNYSPRRSNSIRSDEIDNKDEHHPQISRLKQLPIDDSTGSNTTKLISTDLSTLSFSSKQSLTEQLSSLPSSSQPNRNHLEQNSNLSRNNSRSNQNQTKKKRKQSQQQDIIRTELIPGHRGDRDVDELVKFIDGNSSKQIQNSVPLRPTDTNKPQITSKINTFNDTNSNKTSSRKKSRKTTKSLTNDYENKTINDDQDNQITSTTITHSNIDISNQQQNISKESQINIIHTTDMINHNSSEQINKTSKDIDSSNLSPSIMNNSSNSEIISEPFVTVTHRRRVTKERRQDNNNNNIVINNQPPPPVSRSTRPSPTVPPVPSSNTNDKRRVPPAISNGNIRPAIPNKLNNSPVIKEENMNSISSETTTPPPPSPLPVPSTSTTNPINDQPLEKQQNSPRLSSHSSSSSLSSLLKRQSKAPPVVFLNKSIDIELNDVSFGFDLDSSTLEKSSDENNPNNNVDDDNNNNNNTNQTSTIEQEDIDNTNSPNEPNQSQDIPTQKNFNRKFQQRNTRGPQFYSGSDIRPQHHRNYPTQQISATPYIDPLLFLQYNQRYQQQIAYMNYLRSQYISPQSQYIYLPTTAYPTRTTTTTTTTNETDADDETNQTSTEQIQEPLLVYAASTGQYYLQPSTTTVKKPYTDSEQQTVVPPPPSVPTAYASTPPIYSTPYYYHPSQIQHLVPSHPAYFQPITSPSLLIDTKSEQNDNNDDIDLDDDYEQSTKLYSELRHQSSSDIMSNALQLVYSQQKRNAQTDRFNLDDLTAYLAMKWTDTIDHYVQGDSRILLVNEQ